MIGVKRKSRVVLKDVKVLQKLIDYYSTAVGYYESINDPKFMIYNQSLSLLFSQPEVKKYLSGGNIKLKLKKENIQKIIQECDKKVTTEKVKNFIRRKSAVDSKKTINKLINKDMDTQTSDFKKRLAEKKKRYRLSTSDMAGSNDIGRALKNMGLNNNFNNDNKNNKSIDLAQDKDFKISDYPSRSRSLSFNVVFCLTYSCLERARKKAFLLPMMTSERDALVTAV